MIEKELEGLHGRVWKLEHPEGKELKDYAEVEWIAKVEERLESLEASLKLTEYDDLKDMEGMVETIVETDPVRMSERISTLEKAFKQRFQKQYTAMAQNNINSLERLEKRINERLEKLEANTIQDPSAGIGICIGICDCGELTTGTFNGKWMCVGRVV